MGSSGRVLVGVLRVGTLQFARMVLVAGSALATQNIVEGVRVCMKFGQWAADVLELALSLAQCWRAQSALAMKP